MLRGRAAPSRIWIYDTFEFRLCEAVSKKSVREAVDGKEEQVLVALGQEQLLGWHVLIPSPAR